MHVLICEDNPLIAMELEMLVEEMGHDCCGMVDSSHACLSRLEDCTPEVVLVDLDLSDGPTGLDLVNRLHGMGVPSLIVSGQANMIDRPHSARAALEKPVNEAELESALASICNEGSTGPRLQS